MTPRPCVGLNRCKSIYIKGEVAYVSKTHLMNLPNKGWWLLLKNHKPRLQKSPFSDLF